MKAVTSLSIAVTILFSATLAWAASVDVAVLDIEKVEGKAFGERGIFQLLSKHPDFKAQWIADLQSETLGKFQVVMLADVHDVGKLAEGWEQALRAYVEGGGGVVMTHDCAGMKPEVLFPDVDAGWDRHIGQRISSFTNHPLTFGLNAFDTAFGDHRDLKPGPAGQVVIKCIADKPVAVVGNVGHGRVVHLGSCIGLSAVSDEDAPQGMEARLILNALAWAAGVNPWHLSDYGEITVGIQPTQAAVEQPAPITAAVTVSVRKAEIALPLKIALYDEAGKEVSSTAVIVQGRKQPGRDIYLRTEAEVKLATEGLPDGTYVLAAEGEDVQPGEVQVALRGQLMDADRKRTVLARQALQNTVSKFVFNQGYEFDYDRKATAPVFYPEKLEAYMQRIKETGFNTYDYFHGMIWNEEAFGCLEKVLASAQRHGLKVWATLGPPSGHEEIARWPREKRQDYYFTTVERFAQLSLKYPNFIAFTCDDFDYNYGFFSPEMMAEMARRWQSINPNLFFLPLIYYGGISEEFMRTRGPYIDGVVFHFRAGSYPPNYIDNYDPKSFEMYGDVQRYEFKRIRHIVGDKPLIAGLYIWYYQGGWGVLTPDEKNPTEEHIVRDAVQKFEIAHDYAIGTRIYGVGIDHPAYAGMGKLQLEWEKAGKDWGKADISDPQKEVRKYRAALDNPPYYATLLNRNTALSEYLRRDFGVPQMDLCWRLTEGKFDPEKAVKDFFASRSPAAE